MHAILLPLLLGAIGFRSFAASSYCTISAQNTLCLYSVCTFSTNCNRPMPVEVTAADKAQAVSVHNRLRSNVASGRVTVGNQGRYSPATNMRELSWDDELAKMAQAWVNQCTYQHDANRDVSRFQVGQNIFASWISNNQIIARKFFVDAVVAWTEGNLAINAAIVSSFPANNPVPIGNFTQMIWANTYKVGCGISMHVSTNPAHASTPNEILVACNYGPTGNLVGKPVYEAGPSSSNCPAGTSATSANLCA